MRFNNNGQVEQAKQLQEALREQGVLLEIIDASGGENITMKVR